MDSSTYRRWTGPAEPAVNLAASLGNHGWDVVFACGRHKSAENLVVEKARDLLKR